MIEWYILIYKPEYFRESIFFCEAPIDKKISGRT